MSVYDLSEFDHACGQRIAEKRKTAGYKSQEKFGEALDVSRETIKKIETGVAISERMFNRIVDHLKCTPEYILTGKEETSEEEKLYEDWFSGLSLEKKRWYFNIFKQMEQYPLS